MNLTTFQHFDREILLNPDAVVLVRAALDNSGRPVQGKTHVELSSGTTIDLDGDVSTIAAALLNPSEDSATGLRPAPGDLRNA